MPKIARHHNDSNRNGGWNVENRLYAAGRCAASISTGHGSDVGRPKSSWLTLRVYAHALDSADVQIAASLGAVLDDAPAESGPQEGPCVGAPAVSPLGELDGEDQDDGDVDLGEALMCS